MTSSCCVATEAVIGELTRGREVADQLRQMLRESHAGVDASSSSSVLPAQGLVGKILDSFTHSLSILSSGGDADEVSPVSPSLKSEDSGDSCKTPTPKDRRGCYKRRRSAETWTKETASLFEDGHAWRKYGQKDILNATHPRNYFRCTHKFDQGCQASKQVQKIQEDPPLYRTTYHGQHSCKDFLKSSSSSPHHIIMDPASHDSSNSVIWSFGSRHLSDPTTDNYNKKQQQPNSEAAAIIKEEAKEDSYYNYNNYGGGVNLKSPSSSSSSQLPASVLVVPPSDIHIHGGDYFISNDHCYNLTGFDETSGSWGFSTGSVISSCTTSTNHSSMEMDIMAGSNFEDFQLESFT